MYITLDWATSHSRDIKPGSLIQRQKNCQCCCSSSDCWELRVGFSDSLLQFHTMMTETRVCICERSQARIRKESSQHGWVWMDALPLCVQERMVFLSMASTVTSAFCSTLLQSHGRMRGYDMMKPSVVDLWFQGQYFRLETTDVSKSWALHSGVWQGSKLSAVQLKPSQVWQGHLIWQGSSSTPGNVSNSKTKLTPSLLCL